MRKVVLRMNEELKYQIIKKVAEGCKTKERASVEIGCTVRHVNRLLLKYKQEGKAAFIHGNRGRKPSTTIPLDVKEKVVNCYVENYIDTNFTHFCEIIEDDLAIKISDTTLNKWLREINVISPKARRKTRKQMKKLLKAKMDETKSKKVQDAIKQQLAFIDEKDAHPRRARCKYAGEMIQMDASSFEWVEGHIWHLHLAVDDATNEVVGAYFDTQETLIGYYNVFYQILTNYGIPAMFYTDRRTIFEYKKKKHALDDEDTFTQFSYACKNLGVEIKTTSVAQAKGRIERLNQTFQSRLPVELRRAQIKDIEAANQFLNTYLKKFNEQFSLRLNTNKSVYENQPTVEKINQTLAIISTRKIDSGNCIKYKNKYYLPVNANNNPVFAVPKQTCLVIESFDKKLYVNINDQLFIMKEVLKHQLISENFDSATIEEKVKKQYIPPLTHPWKQASYIRFTERQKHSL